MQPIPKGGVFRITAAMLLCAATAFGAESEAPEEKTLAVSVSAPDSNEVAQALDLRDLEHFIVSELKHKRFDAVALTSLETRPQSDDSVYLVEIGIDQADIAQRPKWHWAESRFRDDEILHLEVSLSISHADDVVGSLYRSYDLRAEDYGHFASPVNIRAAVYDAAAKLSSDFVLAAARGDFITDVQSFQHPFGLADALDAWSEFSVIAKAGLLLVSILLLTAILGVLYRLFAGVFGLFAPHRPVPNVSYVVVRDERTPLPIPVLAGATSSEVVEAEE